MRAFSGAVLALFILISAAWGGAPGTFELLATYRGLGSMVASAVGPGPTPGSQRLYLSYLYLSKTIDVVAVDPATGEFEVFTNPAPTEYGARCMIVGPDGKIYLGTLPYAHLLVLDPKEGTLKDLGRPSTTESYIWDLAFGPDGKLYGATYPRSKLVRYDPATGALEDLGRMDSVQQYAHYVAAGDDGFIYVGIGTSLSNIAAYQISTGERRSILPAEYQGVEQALVYRGKDGKVYGRAASRYFRLEGWTATLINSSDASPQALQNTLADGGVVSVSGRTVRVTDPSGTIVPVNFAYKGNELSVFRVGFGPDKKLYGSSVLPIHLLVYNSASGEMDELGDLGGGEIYSFLSRGDSLLMAAYSGSAPLMQYDPRKPFKPGQADENNPKLVTFSGSDSSWRPQAMINGPDGRVFLGAVSGYGLLGGPMTIWNPDTGNVISFPHIVKDQSVVTLAAFDNLIVGGTTIGGGGGSFATQKDAKLFIYNLAQKMKTAEVTPLSGAGTINDLITAPNGLVYGLVGKAMFTFDPATAQVKDLLPFTITGAIYNGIAVGPDGLLWGLCSSGVFTIDPTTNTAALVAKAPETITAGFAMDARGIYFASVAKIYRYNFLNQPEAPPLERTRKSAPPPGRKGR
jgi:streptogramin lyase